MFLLSQLIKHFSFVNSLNTHKEEKMKKIILTFVILATSACAPTNTERCEQFLDKYKEAIIECEIDDPNLISPSFCQIHNENDNDCTDYWDNADKISCENGTIKAGPVIGTCMP